MCAKVKEPLASVHQRKDDRDFECVAEQTPAADPGSRIVRHKQRQALGNSFWKLTVGQCAGIPESQLRGMKATNYLPRTSNFAFDVRSDCVSY
jgi:hypothetical protein